MDGRPVAVTGSRDRTVRVWGLAAGQQVGEPLTGHTRLGVGGSDDRGGRSARCRLWKRRRDGAGMGPDHRPADHSPPVLPRACPGGG
ncbi:hypothetical protein ACNPQN_39660, partial [Streptomyces sp. NPDC056297]